MLPWVLGNTVSHDPCLQVGHILKWECIFKLLTILNIENNFYEQQLSATPDSLAQLFGHAIAFCHRKEKKLWKSCQSIVELMVCSF